MHCVIAGLDRRGTEPKDKRLFSYPEPKGAPVETEAAAITAYLFDARGADRHLVVESASTPINGAPPLITGSKPIDGGHFIFDANERAKLTIADPAAVHLLRPFVGAEEYINGGQRWIFALHDASPTMLRNVATVRERVAKVRAFRQVSTSVPTQLLANTPTRYHVNVLPEQPYLVIPQVSSERRDYIPIGWLEPPVIPSDKLRLLPTGTPWHFGVLTSRMHMAWMRTVTGRLKSDYMYSVAVVYNTFPWPEDTSSAEIAKIEELARSVLEARALPKNVTSSLADLYDPDTMPAELRRAHRDLDAAVDRLYAPRGFADDRARVEHLFGRYQRLVEPLRAAAAKNRRTARRTKAADDG